jgi:hypothetical protein
VALLLARSQSTQTLVAAAASALRDMAALFATITEAIVEGRPAAGLEPIHGRIRAALAKADAAAAEVARERVVSPQGGLDPAPLCRTLRRLNHDLIMVARAAAAPLPETARVRLQAPLGELNAFLAGVAEALADRRLPPAGDPAAAALAGEARALKDLRALGLTRDFADDEVARLFGLAFALEQIGANLTDLSARAEELAQG